MKALEWNKSPRIQHQHPIWSGLKAHKVTLKIEGPFCFATIEYSGKSPFGHGSGSSDQLGTPIYETIISLSEDPIDTHKEFVTKIGGKPTAPKNGAIFRNADGDRTDGITPAPSDKGWVFDSFALIVGGQKNRKAKVEAYLNPSKIIFRKTWMSLRKPGTNKAGKLDTPPSSGDPPNLTGGANWLNMGITSVREGNIYHNTEEWMASGPGGWDPDIYSY
jgi:hypothetical protein